MTSVSRTTVYRRKLKELDPQKYAEYLERQKVASRERRAKRKEKWENEPHTPLMVEQRERERSLNRIRCRRHYANVHGKDIQRTRVDVLQPGRAVAPLSHLTPEERRLHRNRLKAESRARQSEENKSRTREKDRQYRKARRLRMKGVPPGLLVPPPLAPSLPHSPQTDSAVPPAEAVCPESKCQLFLNIKKEELCTDQYLYSEDKYLHTELDKTIKTEYEYSHTELDKTIKTEYEYLHAELDKKIKTE